MKQQEEENVLCCESGCSAQGFEDACFILSHHWKQVCIQHVMAVIQSGPCRKVIRYWRFWSSCCLNNKSLTSVNVVRRKSIVIVVKIDGLMTRSMA